MKIKYYYFGRQGPIIEETLQKWNGEANIKFFDVSKNHELAREKKMFSPFLSECNGKRERFGFVHKYEDKIVAGIEYMPSMSIPYDIPKSNENAFIICLCC